MHVGYPWVTLHTCSRCYCECACGHVSGHVCGTAGVCFGEKPPSY